MLTNSKDTEVIDWERTLHTTPDWLIDEIAAHDGKILEVGCASGYLSSIMEDRSSAKVIGADLNMKFLRARKHDSIVCGDATDLPFQSGKFDAIVGIEVIEHVPELREAFEEMHRVVKPNGVIYLKTPNKWLHDAYQMAIGELRDSREWHPSVLTHGKFRKMVDGLFTVSFWDMDMLEYQTDKLAEEVPFVGRSIAKIPFSTLPKPLQPSICARLDPL